MPPSKRTPKRITRYTHDAPDPRTPETGHTGLLEEEESRVVELDRGWADALTLHDDDDGGGVIVDMDPVTDPVLLWAGKRSRKRIPVLPLQRTEIVSESRIRQLIDRARAAAAHDRPQPSLFADLERDLRASEREKRVEFYTHEEGWRNKLICGDSLHVMESLLKYEHLRGRVQLIYVDPPYGVKYDSNFQQRIDTTTNDERDPGDDVLTIKAFNDTWANGPHSYLQHLAERLYLCRELLSDSGSVVVQISDDHVHRVRGLMDEVFGAAAFCSLIPFTKTSGFTPRLLSSVCDYLIWYAKKRDQVKFRRLYRERPPIENPRERYICVETPAGEIIDLSVAQKSGAAPIPEGRILRLRPTDSQDENESSSVPVMLDGTPYLPPRGRHWSVPPERLQTLEEKGLLVGVGKTLTWKSYRDEFPYRPLANVWDDIRATGFGATPIYTVQTLPEVVERCIAMLTDPGDLVLDPTCGSGTTAFAAERLGRRWITCDTSRVAVNVARRRLLSSVFEHFRLKDAHPSGGIECEAAERITLKSLAYGLEPERVELVDRPLTEPAAVRVCGPFEVMAVGRYSLEDWRGQIRHEGTLEDYIGVIARLYRQHASPEGAANFVHAIAEAHDERIGISVGPLTGRVTARQIADAASDAKGAGLAEVHILGWAFEANVGEVKEHAERETGVAVRLVMVRPDSLAEGLKTMRAETLFSPLALPDIAVDLGDDGDRRARVTLKGVGLFDRHTRTSGYRRADSGYVAAWYLDEDYDGDCFVDCQMFFDFVRAPNLAVAAGSRVPAEELELRFTSEPFPTRPDQRVAVKVVDVYGNESTVVRELA